MFLQSSFCYVCLLLIYSVQAVLARASVVPVVVLVEAEPISVGPAKNEKQKTMGYRAETKKKGCYLCGRYWKCYEVYD